LGSGKFGKLVLHFFGKIPHLFTTPLYKRGIWLNFNNKKGEFGFAKGLV